MCFSYCYVYTRNKNAIFAEQVGYHPKSPGVALQTRDCSMGHQREGNLPKSAHICTAPMLMRYALIKIWSDPELAFKEYNAHDNICAFFDANFPNRYQIHRKAYGIETALEISYVHGNGGRVVAFNAEYDALPNIGHACGHNLIATSSIASFIATCEAMTALYSDRTGFTVRLLGTPAEEGGGGKVCLINAGAYKDVDACLMVHPFPLLTDAAAGPETVGSSMCTGMYLAVAMVRVTYTGKPAHAAAAPWEGVNALDAIVSAYVNISLLRQQIRPSERIHGVVANGGDRPNVIPHSTAVDYCIRSETIESLRPLIEKVRKCFEAAATATGCTMDFET